MVCMHVVNPNVVNASEHNQMNTLELYIRNNEQVLHHPPKHGAQAQQ